MKMTQDINMTDWTGVVYAENNSKILQTIEPSAISDKNQTTKLMRKTQISLFPKSASG